MDLDKRGIRRRAGRSQEWVAVAAETSSASVRIYEIAPDEIEDPRKRQRLDAIYEQMAAEAATGDPPSAA